MQINHENDSMESKKFKIIIVGASSEIAKECARIWSQKHENPEFHLVGRDEEKLKKIAQDLKVRNSKAEVKTYLCDFFNPIKIEETIKSFFENPNSKVDIAMIAHGFLPDQKKCQEDLNYCKSVMEINAISPLLFTEGFCKYFEKQNHGKLVVIGSVAGDRGRKGNYVYGASKGMIDRYIQGLQQRFYKSNFKVINVKPGPTDTPMTAHLKEKGAKLASSKLVASLIVRGVDQSKPVIYAPTIWRWIMLIVQHIPSFIFNRLNLDYHANE
jgi:hypothetical protein